MEPLERGRPRFKRRIEFAVMCVMSEVMAHTITLHLLGVRGRSHRLMRKYAEPSGRIPSTTGRLPEPVGRDAGPAEEARQDSRRRSGA